MKADFNLHIDTLMEKAVAELHQKINDTTESELEAALAAKGWLSPQNVIKMKQTVLTDFVEGFIQWLEENGTQWMDITDSIAIDNITTYLEKVLNTSEDSSIWKDAPEWAVAIGYPKEVDESHRKFNMCWIGAHSYWYMDGKNPPYPFRQLAKHTFNYNKIDFVITKIRPVGV